ncbi:MAG: bifunctional 2-C-methyl-D-erythritol 4-phosphate cytidylyltransferase/2-C-methyl-D-erythritol 2,4-cyclodiphosphate synthase [Caulobacteraceae bacterium]|nr:bifunctional 2-C-methyl-D-erythritol 4-phosphate cytidylyltransferase/2-C-methyl-D-erythritol 2,4-cyclodiphosphate synthase [Caulobacteraceae bacterium]
MTFTAIVVAAGAGLRAGEGLPKAWRRLAGRAIARWSVESLLAGGAREVVVVVAEDCVDLAGAALAGLPGLRLVAGGDTRARSVAAGLEALDGLGDGEIVLIHDAARPFLARETIAGLVQALDGADAALPALPVADTLKRRRDATVTTVDRTGLLRAQTPQAFRLGPLRRAAAAWDAAREATDEASMLEALGGRIVLTAGDPKLFKLTYPEDFEMAEQLAAGARITRIGQGVDAHRFGPGDGVDLCGVRIAHTHGLVGHSDADAGLHALTDALLGAIGDGDIGEHFPPSDPKWRGAASHRFVTFAAERIARRGGRVANVDVTLVCEAPKIAPHRAAMRQRVAALLGLPLDRVSVKATTTEAMGFTGRREGLLAQAVVAVETPA